MRTLLELGSGQLKATICFSVGEKQATVSLPGAILSQLLTLLREASKGHVTDVVPVRAELTTQQAAALLHVSRPYLISLLDKGVIPFRRVGTKRRIPFAHLMDYKMLQDARCSSAIADLALKSKHGG